MAARYQQNIHRVPPQTPQIHFPDSEPTLSTSNIQDLSTTAIHLNYLSDWHLSAGYLGIIQDDWTFTVNMLALTANTTPTDITTLAQFLQRRPDRNSIQTLDVMIDEGTNLIFVPSLIKLLKECLALLDARVVLHVYTDVYNRLVRFDSCQDAAQYLT